MRERKLHIKSLNLNSLNGGEMRWETQEKREVGNRE